MESCHDNITVILGIRNSCQVKQRACIVKNNSFITALTANNKTQCHFRSFITEKLILMLKIWMKTNYSNRRASWALYSDDNFWHLSQWDGVWIRVIFSVFPKDWVPHPIFRNGHLKGYITGGERRGAAVPNFQVPPSKFESWQVRKQQPPQPSALQVLQKIYTHYRGTYRADSLLFKEQFKHKT